LGAFLAGFATVPHGRPDAVLRGRNVGPGLLSGFAGRDVVRHWPERCRWPERFQWLAVAFSVTGRSVVARRNVVGVYDGKCYDKRESFDVMTASLRDHVGKSPRSGNSPAVGWTAGVAAGASRACVRFAGIASLFGVVVLGVVSRGSVRRAGPARRQPGNGEVLRGRLAVSAYHRFDDHQNRADRAKRQR
jgi:hypothetical protein